jgi:hemerythrin-like domain-containing protein
MSAVEVMAVLDTVEEDHRLVLEKMQSLKEAVGCLLEPDGRPGDVRAALGRLRDSNRFFAGRFEAHMAEEERTLFPFLERQKPDGPPLVTRLRKDHAEIRRLREELGKCLAVAEEIEDDPPKMVLRDVLAFGWELWELLDDHAHLETQAAHRGADRYLQSALVH